jgi:excisionase family DNA binding protein
MRLFIVPHVLIKAQARTAMNEGSLTKAAFDLAEFCHLYSIGRVKTYELINAGELTALKVGRKTLIPAASAQEWFASLPTLKPRASLHEEA